MLPQSSMSRPVMLRTSSLSARAAWAPPSSVLSAAYQWLVLRRRVDRGRVSRTLS
jgi:hypothetical protein